jgi:N-acetylglucosaminyldiphosphoundecaprenol N-acetyl-beta-D-mannosaminyltransferase
MSSTDASTRFTRLLGAPAQALTIPELTERVTAAIASGQGLVIGNQNLHSVAIYHRDAAMREFYAAADVVHMDGMPLVWWARLMGEPVGREHRVTYLDWLPSLLRRAAERRWRIFYLGSRPGVGERAAETLRERYPGLDVTVHHGFFDATPGSAENGAVRDAIDRSGAQILMVGMGMPRQEQWILENRETLGPLVILPCGACMDYVAGEVPTPPRWMGRMGLEWAYRLAAEPRRLAHRYLVEPWSLLPHAVRDLRHRRRGSG